MFPTQILRVSFTPLGIKIITRKTHKTFDACGICALLAVAAAAAKSLQSCPTLCNPIDGSPPGSPVPGTLRARTLEWVAISFSNAWKWKVEVKSLSRVRLWATPWTAAYQAPPSMGFSKQEYWSGVPLPSPLLAVSPLKFFLKQNSSRFFNSHRLSQWLAATYTNSVTQEVFLSIAWICWVYSFEQHWYISWFQEAYITVITKKPSQICYELKLESRPDKDPLKLNGLPLLIYM